MDALTLLAEADRLHAEKQYAQAMERYREAVARDDSLFDAWCGLGFASAAILEYGETIPALRRAVALRPREIWLHVNLGKALFALGHVSEAVREFNHAARENDPAAREMAIRNIACIAPGDPAMDNASVMQARRRWVAMEIPTVRPMTPRWRPGPKLRIGYYGSYFGAKNWMKMYMGVINAHDRDRFEINLIVDGALPSAEAGYRDHPDDRIWEVDGVTNAELAGHIAAAKLDVLVDLMGCSHQARMPLLLHHAAPVQIAWNGMYGTTGSAAVDCLIGDASAIPPEEERFCVERVKRIPHTYLPFQVFYPVPEVVEPPWLQTGHVTFGSLTSAYKITDQVIAAWSRILHGVAGARLILRNRALDHASNRADIAARFAANGIEMERLTLEGGGEHADFLRTYDRIDIALDVFPYNGGTTTAEAIWQGVPVLTFNGDRWAGRTSRSILTAAGLAEWVAVDEAAFVEMAIGMGRAPESLAARRAGQRAKVAASPVCDTEGLCRALEAIYLEEAAAKA
jgi:protein O-GlcNAc transferase